MSDKKEASTSFGKLHVPSALSVVSAPYPFRHVPASLLAFVDWAQAGTFCEGGDSISPLAKLIRLPGIIQWPARQWSRAQMQKLAKAFILFVKCLCMRMQVCVHVGTSSLMR